jgi:hypothetical protein
MRGGLQLDRLMLAAPYHNLRQLSAHASKVDTAAPLSRC